MPKLIEALKTNNFKQKPIGPLGIEIKIKKDVSEIERKLIECELSGMFNNFIVDNFDDRRLLDRLAKRINCPISIITSKFVETRHDISAGKCQSNDYPSIIGKTLLTDLFVYRRDIGHPKPGFWKCAVEKWVFKASFSSFFAKFLPPHI